MFVSAAPLVKCGCSVVFLHLGLAYVNPSTHQTRIRTSNMFFQRYKRVWICLGMVFFLAPSRVAEIKRLILILYDMIWSDMIWFICFWVPLLAVQQNDLYKLFVPKEDLKNQKYHCMRTQRPWIDTYIHIQIHTHIYRHKYYTFTHVFIRIQTYIHLQVCIYYMHMYTHTHI